MQQDSDQANIVREAIYPHSCTARYGCPTCEAALAALDALVAERDKANADWHRIRDLHDAAITGLRAAEAEVARLREGFEFSCQCGKSYVFPPPSDPRNRDDNPHPDGEEPCMCGGAGCAYCEEDA